MVPNIVMAPLARCPPTDKPICSTATDRRRPSQYYYCPGRKQDELRTPYC